MTKLVLCVFLSTNFFILSVVHFNQCFSQSVSHNSLTDDVQQKYIIHNENCAMPDIPPFPVNDFTTYEKLRTLSCSNNKPLLTYTKTEGNEATLHIRKEVITQYYEKPEDLRCCYSYARRAGTSDWPDVGIIFTKCHFFNSTVQLFQDIVAVKCVDPDPNPVIIYENVHQVLRVPPQILKKTQLLKSRSGKRPISVLFIVIDSVSRLNFIRTMPLTRNFILDSEFIEYKGYNKIHDNTFPNFVAWLTGMRQDQVLKWCNPKEVGKLDSCPMIWYDFRDHGYVTAYAEDWASIATFNYLKKGFRNPPTDYYFKPYQEASETLNTKYQDTMPFCTGPEAAGDRILNLARDFTSTFKGVPSFGVFWMNTFSHNFINSTMAMDFNMRNFFSDLRRNGVLEESFVFLLSDHGIRFGDIIATTRGFFEERLPLNYVSIPPWFRNEYPILQKNMQENSQKLTSTFDLYMTLQHILEMSGSDYKSKGSHACPNCQSLFEALPDNRSCIDAGIPEKWCTCLGHFFPITKQEYGQKQLQLDLTKAMVQIPSLEPELQNKSTICYDILSLEKTKSNTNVFQNGQETHYYLIKCRTDAFTVYQVLIKKIKLGYYLGNDVVHVRRLYNQ